MNVFLDIETLQTESESDIAALRENAKAPANLKDPAKIAAAKEAAFTKTWEKTGLDGTYGTIACICWAFEDDMIWTSDAKDGDEASCIRDFLAMLSEDLTEHGPRPPWFVGFNIPFDLRFIWRRAKIHGLHIPFKIPYNAAPWNNKYTDLMYEWCGAKDYIKLKELCRVFGLNDGGDIDGADVYKEWKAGNYEKVIAHCREDVERVRRLHERIC